MKKIRKFSYSINNIQSVYATIEYQLHQLEKAYNAKLFAFSEIKRFVESLWDVDIENCKEISVSYSSGTPFNFVNIAYVLNSSNFGLGVDYVPFWKNDGTIGVLLNLSSSKARKLKDYIEEYKLMDEQLYIKLDNLNKRRAFQEFVKHSLHISLDKETFKGKHISSNTEKMLKEFYYTLFRDEVVSVYNFLYKYNTKKVWEKFEEFLRSKSVRYY